jgi:hypothetical protein
VRHWARIFFALVAYCAVRCTVLVAVALVGMAPDVSLWAAVALNICLWGMTAFSYRFHEQKTLPFLTGLL